MLWQILVRSVEPRTAQLCELFDVLVPQLVPGEVEVLCCRDGFALTAGTKANLLLERCTGQYVSFIDDDDLVEPDFVATIVPFLDGTDMVSFDIEANGNGYEHFLVRQSLALPESWGPSGRQIPFGHLCPMRRDIATMGRFAGQWLDDEEWRRLVRQSGRLRTEHHIDRVLYHYRVSDSTLWRRPYGQVPLSPHPAYPCVTYTEGP